jgi:hypothetical protein
MRIPGALVALFLILMVAVCGCANFQPPGGSPAGHTISPSIGPSPATPSAVPPGKGMPTVFISSPPFDGGILAGNVTILVEVTNFTLIPQGGADVPGTGHLIYYRDVTPVAVPGYSAFTQPGTYAVSAKTLYTWPDIAPGTHTFAVQLVHADDTPLDPPVIDAIDVTAVVPEMITGS